MGFAANPRHRPRVQAFLKAEVTQTLLPKFEHGNSHSGTFALKLICCHLCGYSAWKVALDRLLASGFACELEEALQAAIEQREYPVGTGVRPLVPKLAHLFRRLAECGFSRHQSPRLAALLVAAVQRAQDLSLVGMEGYISSDSIEIPVAASRSLAALFEATAADSPFKLDAFKRAAGLRDEDQDDVESCAIDRVGIMIKFGIEDIGEGSESDAEEAIGTQTVADEGMLSHPTLSQATLNALMYRELGPEDYEILSQLDEGVARRPSPTEMLEGVRTLPEYVVDGMDVGDRCAVCLEAYAAGDVVKRLQCSHLFHSECRRCGWCTRRTVAPFVLPSCLMLK